MWIEITDEKKRKVLINMDNVTQITDSGEETENKNYIFFMSILSNCYWVFDSKQEKDIVYNHLKLSLELLILDIKCENLFHHQRLCYKETE